MSKKIISFLLIIFMIFTLFSCANAKDNQISKETEKPFEPTEDYTEIISPVGLTLEQAKSYLSRIGFSYSVEGNFGNVKSFEYDGGIKDNKIYVKKGSSIKIFLEDTRKIGEKVIYLTFDDGPNANTDNILSILKKYNATATFFIYGNRISSYPTNLKSLVASGNEIGCHSYTHDLDRTSNGFIYASTTAFCNEVKNFDAAMRSVFGTSYDSMPKLLRFPGGSSTNGRLTKDESKTYIDAVRKLGYKVYDWTCLTNDADSREQLENESNLDYFMRVLKRSIAENDGREPYILLMHEKQITVETLDDILSYLVNEGFSFDVLSNCPEYTFTGH